MKGCNKTPQLQVSKGSKTGFDYSASILAQVFSICDSS